MALRGAVGSVPRAREYGSTALQATTCDTSGVSQGWLCPAVATMGTWATTRGRVPNPDPQPLKPPCAMTALRNDHPLVTRHLF